MAPDKRVYLLYCMLDLVVSILRLYSQFKNQPVNFVHDKRDFNIFLNSMPDD